MSSRNKWFVWFNRDRRGKYLNQQKDKKVLMAVEFGMRLDMLNSVQLFIFRVIRDADTWIVLI